MDSNLNTFYYNLEQNDRYSNDLRKDIDSRVQELINNCYHHTKNLLNKNESFVVKIKEALIENDSLDFNDLIKFIKIVLFKIFELTLH